MKAQIISSGIERVKSARVVIDAPTHQIFAVIDNPYRHPEIDENSTKVISSYDGRVPFLLRWYADYDFRWAPQALAATLDRLKLVVEQGQDGFDGVP